MMVRETVYCVECDSLLKPEQAEMIFKTGYYMHAIPLGICKNCGTRHAPELYIETAVDRQPPALAIFR